MDYMYSRVTVLPVTDPNGTTNGGVVPWSGVIFVTACMHTYLHKYICMSDAHQPLAVVLRKHVHTSPWR